MSNVIKLTNVPSQEINIGNTHKVDPGVERCISDVKLIGTTLVLYFYDNTTIEVELGSLGGGGLTSKQIEALENMSVSIVDGELVFDYDEEVLDFTFNIEDGNLIVNNNEAFIDFNINESNEMEVSY